MFPPQKPKVLNTIRVTAKVLGYSLSAMLGLAALGFIMKCAIDLCGYVYTVLSAMIANEIILVALSVTLCMVLSCAILAGLIILVQYVSYWFYKIKYNKKVRWF